MNPLARAIVLAVALMFVPASASAQCSGSPVLAMTYNIRLDTPADGANSWAYRRKFLIGQIAALRPELLGLQEVLLNQKRDLEAAFPGYRFLGVGRDDGKDGGEFSPLAIETREFKIGENGTYWLSPSPAVPSLGWDAGYKRLVTWARLVRRRDRANLLVLNTHWDHQGLTARLESGKLIFNWLERHRKPGERVILLGDFNADAAEESVAQLSAPSARGFALFDTGRLSATGSTGPSFSFNGFDPIPKSGKLIDHIFVGTDIAVQAHAVVAQHENGRVASDHFPVVALLDIQRGQGGSCRSSGQLR